MKNVDTLQYNLTEAATLAHKYTANTDKYKDLIIELAVIPDGIEVRGVMVILDKEPIPSAYILHWLTMSEPRVNPLVRAIEYVKNALMEAAQK